MGYDGLRFNPERVDLFRMAVTDRLRVLVSGGLEADDIKLFVKQEPHSAKKLLEGRYRLISAVSMVDTMIDRMLFGPLVDNVLASAGKTPVMIGWVPILGGYRLLRRKLPGRVVCIDKSSWDWTVPMWMVSMWLDIILQLSNGAPPFVEHLMRRRFKLLFEEAVFRFPDGVRVKQEIPGIMKSGCYLTIVLNSLGQVILHYLIANAMGEPPLDCEPFCMGDDTVQSVPSRVEEYVRRIGELGFKVKEVKEQDWIEFAGFMIDDTTWPVYWEKHIYCLQHAEKELEDMLENYMFLYAAQPAMYEFLRSAMLKVNPKKAYPRSILVNFVSGGSIFARAWATNCEGVLQMDLRI